MELLTGNKLDKLRQCSGILWNTFKDLCEAAKEIDDKGKIIDMSLAVFRDKVQEYHDTDIYGYAVQYSHTLIYEIESMIYGKKVKVSQYQENKRMARNDFIDGYINNPNPRDMITVMDDGNGLMTTYSVRSVVKI